MAYSREIAFRYLRSKKRATVSTITVISIVGVALGVAALLAVLSITTGFERAFRDKVLGVNAHVLILKYGRDFKDYREVLAPLEKDPEIAGVAPFVINEMMLSKGDRLSGVLVKGVDPVGVREVLDLPKQLIEGDLRGLRLSGAVPAGGGPVRGASDEWKWLEDISKEEAEGRSTTGEGATGEGATDTESGGATRRKTAWEQDAEKLDATQGRVPKSEVASPGEIESLLDGIDDAEWDLPDNDDWESGLALDDAVPDRSDLPGMVVGKTLADDLEIAVGDTVTLISPLSGLDLSFFEPGTATTRSREFRVIGIFQAGFQEYDSRLVYTDLYEAQRFYDQGDSVTGIELRVHDLSTSEALARRIERDLSGAFHTLDWSELNRNLFTALQVQKVALTLVIATIIFVAAFNVIATLIMIVLEKKREIAILKAMGATDRTILSIFMLQGTIVGVIGTVVGVAIGGGLIAYLSQIRFPLDPKVYLIDHLPVVLNPAVVSITVAIALAICTLSTIAPSWWAARMLPVDGLRYE